MSTIYSIFSNPSGDLPNIQYEFGDLFNFFNEDLMKKKVNFKFLINPSIENLTSEIIANQNETKIFHFSGHSGPSGLDFFNEEFSSDHVINFFNTINSGKTRIQCIIINGCENVNIIERLNKIPIVIGTKSKIQDASAKKFIFDFFISLVKSETSYLQAFKDASSAQNNLGSSHINLSSRAAGRISSKLQLAPYFIISNDKYVIQNKFPFLNNLSSTKDSSLPKMVEYTAVILGIIGTLITIFTTFFSLNLKLISHRTNLLLSTTILLILIAGYSYWNYHKQASSKRNILKKRFSLLSLLLIPFLSFTFWYSAIRLTAASIKERNTLNSIGDVYYNREYSRNLSIPKYEKSLSIDPNQPELLRKLKDMKR